MRIVVHDYSGHPCQVHLSRELARRGHAVEHQYCGSYTTGRGATARREDDPTTFDVRAVDLGSEFARYSPLTRVWQEVRYAFKAKNAVVGAGPDVAILSNVPLISLLLLTLMLRLKRLPYVFWQQDVYSDAIGVVARRRLGAVGGVIARLADFCERGVARGAAAVVPISDTFLQRLDAWAVGGHKTFVIPNWAAIDEMPSRPRVNRWARTHGLDDVPVVMYAGTLGLKHDPSALAELARHAPPGAKVVVVSEGKGRQWLTENAGDVSNLMLLDFQPYEDLPDMLASADVLVVLLENDASRYSVPSKVLNYLCAGRPVLALLPEDNAVAKTVTGAGAGVVIPPGDVAAASAALNALLDDDDDRASMGRAARAYASLTFDVSSVGDDFEAILDSVVHPVQMTRAEFI